MTPQIADFIRGHLHRPLGALTVIGGLACAISLIYFKLSFLGIIEHTGHGTVLTIAMFVIVTAPLILLVSLGAPHVSRIVPLTILGLAWSFCWREILLSLVFVVGYVIAAVSYLFRH